MSDEGRMDTADAMDAMDAMDVAVDLAEEAAYWRGHHLRQPYTEGRPFELYEAAYRMGGEAFCRLGRGGSAFREVEAAVRALYEDPSSGDPALPWGEARPAARAAWSRLEGARRLAACRSSPR